MLPGSPFEAAARDGGDAGACPVTMLDAFYTNHWDFDSLCSGFACAECVATPEDMGFGGPAERDGPASATDGEEDWEIPF